MPPLLRLLFSMHQPTDVIAHTTAFVTSAMRDRSDNPSHHERRFYHMSDVNILVDKNVRIL